MDRVLRVDPGDVAFMLCMMTDRERRIRSNPMERMLMTATTGEMAPAFSLPGTAGPGLDLAARRGQGRAALFFYPMDRTAG
jgi:hypothetical protein